MIQEGNADEIVPKKYWKWLGGGACIAYRFNSLVAQGVYPLAKDANNYQGDDDFFSSDLSIERLKNIWQDPAWKETPVLVLYGDKDQYVPSFVDKQKMVIQWRDLHGSGVSENVASRSLFTLLPHANHELSDARFYRHEMLAY
jgi:pimeloyl-ACP methyl ester carboxylesterase